MRNKKKELDVTSTLVALMLESDEMCRNSDRHLILCVYDYMGKLKGVNIREKSFAWIMENSEELDFPSFETIRRERQKVQEKHPELKAVKKVKEFRDENEKIYREEMKK